MFSHNVPYRVVHRTQRHGEDASSTIKQAGTVHLVPELLGIQSICADQKVFEVSIDNFSSGCSAGTHPKASDTLVCFNDGNDGRGELFKWASVTPAPWVVVRCKRRCVQESV